MVDDIAKRFQVHPEMTPYVNNPPFDVDNLDILITVDARSAKKNNKNTVITAFTARGKIFYITRDLSLSLLKEDVVCFHLS